MSTFLGLLELIVFIAAIISLAAGVTWLVVKLSPPANGAAAETPPKSS